MLFVSSLYIGLVFPMQVGSEATCALQDIRLVISYLKMFGVKEQVCFYLFQ